MAKVEQRIRKQNQEVSVIELFFPLVALLVIIAAVTVLSDHKLKAILEVLHYGLKNELTTVPGFISLVCVAVVAFLGFSFTVMHEVQSMVTVTFLAEEHSGYNFPVGFMILGPVMVIVVNFLFVAYMRPPR